MKHFPYSLLLAASLWGLPVSALAARLENWQFDARQNLLEFTTDIDVQPQAQLIPDPTRLVIDLPGVRLDRPSYTQSIPDGGVIRAIRFGQFDPQTMRIVVELAPGYTLDPNQVRFRGITARRWTVQIPTPTPVAAEPAPIATPPSSPPPSSSPTPGATTPSPAVTTLETIRVTTDGFFLRTNGRVPQVRQSRSRDRRQITLDLPNTTVAASVARDQMIGRYGVSRIQIVQEQTTTRLIFNVTADSPDWQGIVSDQGVAVVPAGGVSASSIDSRPGQAVPPTSAPPQLATIQSVSLENGSGRLLIRADQPVQYTTGWDRTTASYRVTINSAQLADNLSGPNLDASSPILQLRLRQEDPRTVVIYLQPAAGVQIQEVRQFDQRAIALDLMRSRPVLTPPTATTPPTSIPVPEPPQPTTPPPTIPPAQNGRVVVVIDPGHGGSDPGAIGIGGVYEKDIVLDISRKVSAELSRQGIQVIMTRQNDVELGLGARVQTAQRANAAVFVSIHANAMPAGRSDVNGLETYYFSNGLDLARSIHSSILQMTGMPDRRVRQARFYVLRNTTMPSVLVETGFLTGASDIRRLTDENFRSQMARAIAQGIMQYLQASAKS